MIVKQTFIAFDGKEFETEKECAKYEAANELVNITPIFKKVKKICSEQETCYSCVFNNTSGVIMHNACEDHIVDPKYIKRDMNPDAPDPYEIAMNVARNEFDQINRSIK